MNLAETESQHMQRAAGANQHRAEHGSARRGRRNALTDPRLVRSTGQVLHLDFDPSVVGIASQPLWLHWTDEGGPCFCRTPLAEQVHRVSSHKPATGGAGQTSCHPVKNRGHEAFWIESVKFRTQR